VAPGDVVGDRALDQPHDGFGFLFLDPKEVVPTALPDGRITAVDAMGIHHDAALLGLAEDLCQADHQQGPRGDQIGQHVPRADRRQLIDVPDHDKLGARGNRPEELGHQDGVDHRGVIGDHEVGLERP